MWSLYGGKWTGLNGSTRRGGFQISVLAPILLFCPLRLLASAVQNRCLPHPCFAPIPPQSIWHSEIHSCRSQPMSVQWVVWLPPAPAERTRCGESCKQKETQRKRIQICHHHTLPCIAPSCTKTAITNTNKVQLQESTAFETMQRSPSTGARRKSGSFVNDKYRQLSCIGKGTFGHVWTVRRVSDGEVRNSGGLLYFLLRLRVYVCVFI